MAALGVASDGSKCGRFAQSIQVFKPCCCCGASAATIPAHSFCVLVLDGFALCSALRCQINVQVTGKSLCPKPLSDKSMRSKSLHAGRAWGCVTGGSATQLLLQPPQSRLLQPPQSCSRTAASGMPTASRSLL